MATRKVAVFTGNRSEYGLLYPILRAIAADPRLEYQLLVGGAHVNEDCGGTAVEIERDGFRVAREVRMPARPQTHSYTAHSIADGIQGVACILEELAPDIVLLYGDRFESFAALIAATQMNLPAAHVEGGDYTEGGALDDSVRHAMTKLAHLHFTTNSQATERVLKLGEEPWRVTMAGLPALDLARQGIFATPEELLEEFGFDLSRPLVLFCQHSIATESEKAVEQIEPSLQAIRKLAACGFQTVITYPNDDAGGHAIIRRIEEFDREGMPGVHVTPSLGRHRFHGMLHLMGRVGRGVLVGNSSAGIKETRAFACPCINIGSRQQGRLRCANVIDVDYAAAQIADAIRRAVEDRTFRELCRTCENFYGEGNCGARIAEILATVPLDARLLRKRLTF
ncbi:MAG TPA: UDP-N-acetylglucosamine 2-epimerase [Candidatus Acidoferrales bacterium]|nr:UDP-N-acetylglucosamine 2-epimerase [Candidatus Acidoferrales bacterium]